MESLESRDDRLVLELSNGLSLVFCATHDWGKQREIDKLAGNNGKQVRDGHRVFAWEKFRAEGETNEAFADAVVCATHMASRHVGIAKEDGFLEEPWPIENFLAIKAKDGYAFDAIMQGLNAHIGVGFDVKKLAEVYAEKKDSSTETRQTD